ncbi:MAG: MFS transporter [Chloroflexota bacterium]
MISIKTRFYYGYVIVLAGFLIVMTVEGLLLYSFGLFYAALLAEFGWTRAMTSGAFSLASLVRLPVTIFVGKLVDRFGSRPVLTGSGLLLGIGYILMSRVNTVLHLYLFYGVIVALGLSLYWVPLIAAVPGWFPGRAGSMMGIVTSGIGVGQIFFPPLVSHLIVTYGWRTSFIIVGSIGLAVTVVAAQFLRRSPQQPEISSQGEGNIGAAIGNTEAKLFRIRQMVGTKRFWTFGLIYFFWIVPLSIVMVHIAVHAIGLGMTSSDAAQMITIIGITTIVGRLFFGRMADAVGNKKAVMLSLSLMSTAFIWLLVADQDWMLYLFAAIFGLSYGVFELLQSPIAANLFGSHSLGTVLGVFGIFAGSGLMVGPVLAGYIFDITSSYSIAFVIAAICCIVAAVLTALLRQTPLTPR